MWFRRKSRLSPGRYAELQRCMEEQLEETVLFAAQSAPVYMDSAPMEAVHTAFSMPTAARKKEKAAAQSLDDLLRQMDEGFSQMLLRMIAERGMKESQCYKRANIDRKLFSKIRNDPAYHPSKPTAAAFAIALELDLAQTRELLGKAGFSLTRSSKFDIILEYYISRGIYDLYEINEALYRFDQPLLGA